MTTMLGHEELAAVLKRSKRAKRRREAIENFFVDLIAGILSAFWNGWVFMLGVSIAHAEWLPMVPTIGYWWAVLLVWLLRGVFSRLQSNRERKHLDPEG